MKTHSALHVVPKQKDLYLPVLLALEKLGGAPHKDVKITTARAMDPEHQYRNAKFKNGRSKFDNVIGLALFYCGLAGLVGSRTLPTGEQFYYVTDEGSRAARLSVREVADVVKPFCRAYQKQKYEERNKRLAIKVTRKAHHRRATQDSIGAELHTRVIKLYKIAPHLYQREIAEIVGCSQPTVSQILRRHDVADNDDHERPGTHPHTQSSLQEQCRNATKQEAQVIIVEYVDIHLEDLYSRVQALEVKSRQE